LYYWLSAALYRIAGDISLTSRVILMRIVSVLLASFSLPFGFLIALRVPGKSTRALQAAALIAAMPVLTFTATHAANDGLAIGPGTVLVWPVLERKSTALFFSLGAALLTKAYFLAFLAPMVLHWQTWATIGSLTGNVILVHPSLTEMAYTMHRLPVLFAERGTSRVSPGPGRFGQNRWSDYGRRSRHRRSHPQRGGLR
jgi:hypothetical protein